MRLRLPATVVAISFLVAGVSLPAVGQYVPWTERGDPAARRQSELDANKAHTSVHNFGLNGRTGGGQGTPYEWETGTGRFYLALSAMFVGGEVVDGNGDTIQIVSVPAFRSDPSSGDTWNFEPVPEYLNPASAMIARSDDPSTWPAEWPDKLIDSTDPGWPGSWNGLLGKNVLIDGNEYYYHSSDDLYDRYDFFPDEFDSTRRGLGIVVSERVLEFRDEILEDALIVVSDIFNVGTSDITRAAVTIWIADFVGGDGDSQDDKPTYNLAERDVYFNDLDGVSSNPAFQGVRVGTPTLVFAETPSNLGFTNLQYFPAGAINFQTTPDAFFWDTFMVPGSFFDPNAIPIPGEFDLFASCGFFPLPAGSSERLVTGYVFSQDSSEGKRKSSYLKAFVAGGYLSHAFDVSIRSPVPGQMISGPVEIQWNADNGNPDLLIDIYYSSDFGEEWTLLLENVPNTSNFIWNPSYLSDGVLYKLRVVAHSDSAIGFVAMDSSFTINNPLPASPQIIITSPVEGLGYQDAISVQWFAGDPDGSLVSIALWYRTANYNPWVALDSGLTNTGAFDWDISDLPNSPEYSIRASVMDLQSEGMDTVGTFRLLNARYGVPDSAEILRNTLGTGLIIPHVADSTELTGHRYRVEFTGFPDSVTTYDVIDEFTGLTVVDDATEVRGNIEGPLFDGMRMYIEDDELGINDTLSAWNRAETYAYSFSLWSFGFEYGVPEYGDYLIPLDTVGVDTSQTIRIGQATFPPRVVNFTVTNTVTGQRVPFGFVELDGTDGRFTARIDGSVVRSDFILMLTADAVDSLVPSWKVSLDPTVGSMNPEVGDSLRLVLFKPFADGDQYVFEAILGPMLGVKEHIPLISSLSQNFPNPFNPTTEIRFHLGEPMMVTLEIFDILGRKVRTLISDPFPAGEHRVVWDGKNNFGDRVSTGVYIYRLRAGSFVKTNKMLLLR